MKKITLSFSLILILQISFAQIETTIHFSETKDTSIFDVQLVKNTEDDFILSISGKEFTSVSDNRNIDRTSSTFSGICNLNKLEPSIHSKKIVTYPFSALHIEQNSNTVFAVGSIENTKTQNIQNSQLTTQCKSIVVAMSDTQGEGLVTFIEQTCDFDYLYSSIFYEGHYYILYLANQKRFLLKLNELLELQSKTEIFETIIEAVPSETSNSFLVTISDSEDWESQKKSNLHFDGSVDDISNFFSFPIANRSSAPKSILDIENGWIYGYAASQNTELSMIYKYSLGGELLGEYTIGHKHLDWIVKEGKLIVVSQTYYNEEDLKPLNITVFNESFSAVKNSDFGQPHLLVTDVYLNIEFDEYLIAGFIDTHFGDETIVREVSKMYFLQGTLSELIVNPLERNSSFYYPNPSNDSEVYMKITSHILPESQESIEMVFIDISGKKFDASANFIDSDLIKVDVSNLPKGVYVGTLQQNGERIFSSKLVVK